MKEINGFYKNSLNYGDMVSLYIEKIYWDVLDIAGLVGSNLCEVKNDYETGGIFYGLFLAPKIKYCSTVDNYAIRQEHKTFKGFHYSKRLLDRSRYFRKIEGKKISPLFLEVGKKIDSGIVIPAKMRFYFECGKEKCCDRCSSRITDDKQAEANLPLLGRQVPIEFDYMLLRFTV